MNEGNISLKQSPYESQIEEVIVESQYDMISKLKVYKRSDMIQKSRGILTLREQKAIMFMLSKVKLSDEEGKSYEFDISEFMQALGITGDAKYNYSVVLKMLKKLADKSWWIKRTDGKEGLSLVRWFETIDTEKDKVAPGKVQIKFHRSMYPYINKLFEQKKEALARGEKIFISSLDFCSTIPMKHKYSIRLFDLLNTYSNNDKWTFPIEDFKELLADVDDEGNIEIPKRWNNIYSFQKSVIEPAIHEINEYSERLKINYTLSKMDLQGRAHSKVRTIIFYINEKNVVEKQHVHKRIYDAVNEFEDEDGQMTIFSKEYLRISQEEDAIRAELIESEKVEHDYNITKTIHAILTEKDYDAIEHDLQDKHSFTKEQAKAITHAAKFHLPEIYCDPKYLSEMEKMWLEEYIESCVMFIQADESNTKVSFYNRLLDAVMQDRFRCASKIKVL